MPILLWNDRLTLGHDEIDSQHMLLVDMINELYDHLQDGRPEGALLDAIQGLRAYAGYHFAEEERLMLRHGFPELQDHRLAHLDFSERVDAFTTAAQDAARDTALDILDFLTRWLGEHIQQSDRRFVEALADHGRTSPEKPWTAALP